MDKVFEKAVNLLGSTLIITVFALWLVYHAYEQRDYLSFISEMAILIGLFILRGQNVQNERFEKNQKKDLAKSDKILKRMDK